LPFDDEEEKDKIVGEWLSASARDLEAARVLYDNKLFAGSLYHLQQSNEKLAKALLLSIGILTPKRTAKDWKTKSVLGFLPKVPSSYRHRTFPSLLADMEKSVPFIEEFLRLLKRTAYVPWVADADKTVRTSKKGVKKLKKKPFGLVKTTEELEKEVKNAQSILEAMEQVTTNADQQLERLDYEEILRIAAFLVKRAGFEGDTGRPPSLDEVKAMIIPKLRITVLACFSAALASLLDPLESVARYPDSQQVSFDQNNPFIKNFNGLYDVIAQCLEKSRAAISNKTGF
jgi:hypothetical protein